MKKLTEFKRNLKEYSQFINLPPRNPTQTKYLRFLRKPSSGLKTPFTDAMKDFNNLKNLKKNYFDKFTEKWQ